jgi:long-chain fatty acid transport protein
MMNKHIRLLGCLGVMLSAYTIPGHAAFFQLAENSPAGLGNAFAGGAAVAEDASTVWYNPAGMSRLPGRQTAVGAHVILYSAEFSKTSATLSSTLGGGAISGGNGGELGRTGFVPNAYYTQQIDDRLSLGLGVNAPFGLVTDYDDGWVGRYHADRSQVKTINVNPSASYRVNDRLSLGAGFNIQRIKAVLTNALDYGSICAVVPGVQGCEAPGALDGNARVEADNTAFGFNLGLLWQAGADTRLGLAYRSKIAHKLQGSSTLTAPSPAAAATAAAIGISSSAVQAYVTLPETISVSAFHQLNNEWAIMGDVTRTRWSRFPELRIDFLDNAQSDSVVTFALEDVNRYSIGATYSPGGNWSYRMGVAFDDSPTPSAEFRSARLPDDDRTWLALGASHRYSETMSVDLSFVHIRVDDAEINKNAGTSPANENFLRGNLVGSYEADINILSAQARWAFK